MADEENRPAPCLLLVDDSAAHRHFIRQALGGEGYEFLEAANGRQALEILAREVVDLIILDHNMPEMTGLEVCDALRTTRLHRDAPIILVTANNTPDFLARGLAAGANDFIGKPYHPQELVARTRTAIARRVAELALQRHRQYLEQLVEERTRQLVHADRLVTLGTLTAGVAHEINNPNNFIIVNAGFLKHFWAVARPVLAAHVQENPTSRLAAGLEEVDGALDGITSGSKRIGEIVATLKGQAKSGQPDKKITLSAGQPVREALELLHPRLKKGVAVTLDIPENITVHGNPQQLSQVFINLISNALDAMSENRQPPPSQKIHLSCSEKRGRILFKVRDNGPGMADTLLAKIFEPFFTTKGATVGTGLGLTIVQTIVAEHGGKISVTCPLDGGAEFQVMLPGPEGS